MTRTQGEIPGGSRGRISSGMTAGNQVNAGVGGVGGGTGLVAIAQQVGAHTTLGQILVYASPAVAVLSGAAIYRLEKWVDWYNEKSVVRRSRRTPERQLKDPHTSDTYKAKIRTMLEDLDHAVAKAEVARVKSITR